MAEISSTLLAWLELPTLTLQWNPRFNENSATYNVIQVGIATFSVQYYRATWSSDLDSCVYIVGGTPAIVLPHITIQTAAGLHLHRLPMSLADWTLDHLQRAATGTKVFPAPVHFTQNSERCWANLVH